MKKILIVTPEIPYPVFKGNQNRIHETIHLLKSFGCDISLAILNFNQKERKSIDIKKDLAKAYNIKNVIVKRHPKFSQNKVFNILKKVDEKLNGKDSICNQDSCPYDFKRLVRRFIRINSPDAVIVNYLKIADVIPSGYKGKTIIDTHDFATEILRAALKLKPNPAIDLNKFEQSEKKWINKFDTVIAINPNEEKEFQRRFNVKNSVFIPGFHKVKPSINKAGYKYDILFVGSSSPFNIDGFMKFNAQVIPPLSRLLGRMPVVAVAGEVSNCAAVKKIQGEHIHRLGRVADLAECYNEAKMVVCPILDGAGMKIKAVEALSYGKAMVTTTLGCDGINITNGTHAIIADDWKEFTNACFELLTNDSKRELLEKNGLLLSKSEYSFTSVAAKWKRILDIKASVNIASEAKKVETLYEKPIRKKAIIFGMDARHLMDINLDIASRLRQQGIFSEIVKVESLHKNFFMQHDFITHSLKEHFSQKNKDIASKWLDDNRNSPLASLSYKGVNIGLDIIVHKKMFPEHYEGEKLPKALKYCILLIETLLELCNKINPSFIVGWNGNGPHMIFIPKIVAKILGLPVLFVERGLLPSTYVIDQQGVNFKSYLAGSYVGVINNEEIKVAEKYMDTFSSLNSSIVNSNDRVIFDKEEINSLLKLKKKGYIFFPEQIEGDSNIILNSPKFKKMRQVIDEVLIVANNLELDLVIRPHPENKLRNIDYPANCIITTDIHLHSLLRYSEFNITINSTTGLESLLLSKPTFVFGNSIYSGKGFTYDVRTADEINQIVRNFECHNLEEETERELKFKSFLSHLLLNYLVHYKDSSYNSITSNIYVELLKRLGFENRLKTRPGITKSCQNLVKCREKILSISNNVIIINTISPEENLYFTGVNRPKFNINDIFNVYENLKSSTIIEYCEYKKVKSLIKSQKKDSTIVLIVKNSSAQVKTLKLWAQNDKADVLFLDEYFIVQ